MYSCTSCLKSYTRSQDLKRHIRDKHILNEKSQYSEAPKIIMNKEHHEVLHEMPRQVPHEMPRQVPHEVPRQKVPHEVPRQVPHPKVNKGTNMLHLKGLIHVLHLMENGKDQTAKVLMKGLAKQLSKPVAEIVTNLLVGNIKHVNVKDLTNHRRLLRSIHDQRKNRRAVEKIIKRKWKELKDILLIIKPVLIEQISKM